jgi:glycosyltransferase involved in cell wall biosynthesis
MVKVEPRRLLLISPGGARSRGGIGSVVREIHDWACSHPSFPALSIIDSRGIGPAFWSPAYVLLGLFRLVWLRFTNKALVAHINVSERGSVGRKIVFLQTCRLLAIPCVVHHHGAELAPTYDRGGAAYRACVRWLTKRAQMNLVLGSGSLDYMVNTIKVNPCRVKVVYNAIADHAARNVGRSDAHKPAVIIMMAHLIPRKGVSELLKACRTLITDGVAFKLIFVGTGEISRFSDEASLLGLADHCMFMGWVAPEKIPNLVASADVFVLPSFNEGLPVSILEALRAGTPVVATPVGSVGEVLTNGKDALLAPPGDVDKLSGALERVIGDRMFAQKIAHEGRLNYERNFSMPSFISQLLDVYSAIYPGR